ncbi:MAG: Clp protease N-terminal domain-containing protein, partial [Achromobacter sp.]
MRFDKLTTKFQQALGDAQSAAARNDHPYIEPVHVLAAMLGDPDSGASSLLARAGVAVNRVNTALEAAIKGLPQVQNGDGNVQIGRDLQSVLTRTDKEAAKRGDTYIAGELFLLALADDKGDAGRILRDA